MLRRLFQSGYNPEIIYQGEAEQDFWKEGIHVKAVPELKNWFDKGELFRYDLVFTQLSCSPVVFENIHQAKKPVFVLIDSYEEFSLYREMLIKVEEIISLSSVDAGGIPLRILEAMSNGIPVIAPKLKDAMEIGGDVALYVEEFEDPQNWAKIIRNLLQNSELYAYLRKLSHQQAVEFRENNSYEKWEKLINYHLKDKESSADFNKNIPTLYHKVTGLLTKEGDGRGLADKMIGLIQFPKNWEQMDSEGRMKDEKEYNFLLESKKLNEFYSEVLESNFSPPSIQVINPKLHIAVDVNAVEDEGSRVRGIGRYMYNQFNELIKIKPEWNFTLCGIQKGPTVPEISNLVQHSNCRYLNWRDFPQINPDLLYVTHPMGPIASEVVKLGPALGIPMVTTFHDLIPLIFPEMYLNPYPHLKQKYYEQLTFLKEYCRTFLCNSQCTANDLLEKAKIPVEHLKVISAGVTDGFLNPPDEDKANQLLKRWDLLKEKYIVFTGVPDQRKNALGMFRGMSFALRALNVDLKLVIIGELPEFLIEILKNLQAQCGLQDGSVIYTGFLEDEDLNALYHRGLALLFPSLYEGFGFPIVEAQAAGLPVIAGNNSSMPEVTGEGGILVDVKNPNEITDAIIEIFLNNNLRQELREKGKRNALRFTWKATAEKTATCIEETLLRRSQFKKTVNKFAI